MPAAKKPVLEIEAALAPVQALNKLALDNAAKLFEMNFSAAKRVAEITLANAREMAEIKDPAAAQAFFAKQPETMKAFAEEAAADAQSVVKLGMEWSEEAGKLVADSVKKAA